MKIAIVGAGAIGGWIAAKLAIAGNDPALLVRPGRMLTGFEFREGETSQWVTLCCSDDAAALGHQDLLIFTVKAFALAEAAQAAAPMIGPGTIVVPMINGVPWWFADPPLASVDPGGRLAGLLPQGQVIGSVVHAAVRREGDAVVVQHADKLILGDPEGGAGERVYRLCALLEDAGIRPDPSNNIRRAIWYKLWGNATINPLSALTLSTADLLLRECKPFLLAGMAELAEVGGAIGCPISESGEDRMAVTARLGPFKTSMLQDVEAGRPIELEALLGAPIELAERHGVDTPNLKNLYAMTRLLAESRGLL